jgi:hypothetical protein
MGLDMYLKGKVYLDYNSPEREEIAEMLDIKGYDVRSVTVELGYWRKANHIHKWFVDNVQNGVDNCSEYYVRKEDLETLLLICKQVIEDKTKAASLLPTQQGFFFGAQQYDDWYYDDLESTVEILENALKFYNEKIVDIYYDSSW